MCENCKKLEGKLKRAADEIGRRKQENYKLSKKVGNQRKQLKAFYKRDKEIKQAMLAEEGRLRAKPRYNIVNTYTSSPSMEKGG